MSSGPEVRQSSARVFLLGGRRYPLRMDYFKYKEKIGKAKLEWKAPHGTWEIFGGDQVSTVIVPRTFVVSATFPADDHSQGYGRGTLVSKSWHEGITAGAIQTTGEVAQRLEDFVNPGKDEQQHRQRLVDFCIRFAGTAFRRPLTEKETVGIVGESGCGKSVTFLSILGLIPKPPGVIESGSAIFNGKDLFKISTEEIFPNKKVVLFGLPGAFTPTCSTKQLPAYDEAYDRFKGLGIDEVYCVSMNDGFVMNAWADELGIKNVKLLSDGNGDFTQSLGMSVNKRHLGFGPRSWRYSIYVINSIVDQAFIEPGFNQTGEDNDPYTCTDPETIINYIQTTLR